MPAVRLSGVSKHFGEAVAVDRLDLSLNAGSLSTFLGPSGCGKTTTLRLVAGLEHPTSGRIEIDGDCVFGPDGAVVPAERRGIGMVFQSYAVWPHLTVFENVAYPLRVKRLPREDIRRRVELALTTVRLLHLRERYPGQLSGGQQQQVALARALVVEPKLLLLDEPLSNLDAQLRDEMRAEIRNLQVQLGLTAIYVTHDQQEALAISDAVIVMERGRIVQQGTPREIYEHPNCRFVAEFLGWTNFLPVEVLDRDHARILGMTLQCRSEGQTSKSEPLCAAVRPDHISLATHSDGPAPTVQARVRSVTYLGTHCACVFEVGGVALQASLVSQAAPAPRSIVALSLDPAGIRIIPGTPTSERPG